MGGGFADAGSIPATSTNTEFSSPWKLMRKRRHRRFFRFSLGITPTAVADGFPSAAATVSKFFGLPIRLLPRLLFYFKSIAVTGHDRSS